MTPIGKPVITPLEPTVLIEGQPAVIAGRSTDDNHSAIIPGEQTVLIADHPAATLDSQVVGESHSVSGKPTVLVAGRSVAECAD